MSFLFTVVIPAYNVQQTLEKTVRSAISQSLDNNFYEILLIDDASTDQTFRVMEKFKKYADNIHVLQNEENIGLGATRNRGVIAAQGEYIVFLDTGDLLRSDILEEHQRIIITSHPEYPEVIYVNAVQITPNGDPLPPLPPRHDLANLKHLTVAGLRGFGVWGNAYLKKFLEEYDIKNTEGHIFEDIEFSVNCALHATRIQSVTQSLYYNRSLYYRLITPGTIANGISYNTIHDAVFALENLHNILTVKGVLKEYYHDWKRFLFKFMNLMAQRIICGAEDSFSLMEQFRDALTVSKTFNDHNLVDRLLKQTDINLPAGNIISATPMELPYLADLAADAVVMIAQVDYHIRFLVPIARYLKSLNIKSVIFHLSTAKLKPFERGLSDQELLKYSDIPIYFFEFADIHPIFLNARAYLSAFAEGYATSMIFTLKEHGIPTVAFYEGIQDDFRISHPPATRRLPYRHTDYLLIPGEYYSRIYDKYNPCVVGLPNVYALLKEEVTFPKKPVVIINVNFSYKILEDCRKEFLETAIAACRETGLSFVISQHPTDRAKLRLPVSSRSVYEEIKDGSILISRFSTCVLEALALGKPVIYHNPHGEQFPKFLDDPMGAFQISTSKESLVQALKNAIAEIDAKVDIRRQAADFLQFHANVFSPTPPAKSAAEAIQRVIERDAENFSRRILHLAAQSPFMQLPSPLPPRPVSKTSADKAPVSKASADKAPVISLKNVHLVKSYQEARRLKKMLVLFMLDRHRFKDSILNKHPKGFISFLVKLIPD